LAIKWVVSPHSKQPREFQEFLLLSFQNLCII
jgi:hypothetical protein